MNLPAPLFRAGPIAASLLHGGLKNEEIAPPLVAQITVWLPLLEGTDRPIKEVLHVVLRLIVQDAPGL